MAGGGGDGDRFLDEIFVWLGTAICCAAKGLDNCWTEESELESESDSEDEVEDAEDSFEDSFAAFFAASSLLGVGTSSSDEDEESDDDDDDDDEAARLFLFLFRFLVGALADAGPMVVGFKVRG